MDSGQIVNVTVFGLSLRILHDLKAALETITPEDTYIQWTNITDPKLDWLLINEPFLDSPNIQRLLQTKSIKVLKLTKRPVSKADELTSFCFETIDKAQLRRWVMKNIYENKTVDGAASVPEHATLVQEQKIDVTTILQQLVTPVNGKIKIFDKTGELAICDLDTQWVWCNRDVKMTDGSLNFTHTTLIDILEQNNNQQHYKFWLWNLIWNSPDLALDSPEQQFFKLKIWPQPKIGDNHTEILKMSAMFARGAAMQDVALKLDLSLGMVQRFVIASTITGFLEVVNNQELSEIQHINEQNSEVSSGIKRFFSGIRRRLGL